MSILCSSFFISSCCSCQVAMSDARVSYVCGPFVDRNAPMIFRTMTVSRMACSARLLVGSTLLNLMQVNQLSMWKFMYLVTAKQSLYLE